MVKSYNGWPASKDPRAIGVNPAWAPLGHRFPGGVKSGDVETVFTYLVEQLHARVEPIDRDAVKDEWGYVFKQSANSPDLVSCHSSGTAIDYNATRHPNGRRGTWTKAQVTEIRRILAELDGVVRWLGDASGTPDEMHFEIRGSTGQVAATAARLRNQEDEMTNAEREEFDALRTEVANQKWLIERILSTLKEVAARGPGDTTDIEKVVDEIAERMKD